MFTAICAVIYKLFDWRLSSRNAHLRVKSAKQAIHLNFSKEKSEKAAGALEVL